MDDGDQSSGNAGTRETYFAPADRASAQALRAQVVQVVEHPVIEAVLESFCGHVLVLNRQRQILAASPEFKEALTACGIEDFVGLRPGEALGCEHAEEGPAGCGTSLACQHCGAALAILLAQCCLGPVYEECWISMRRKNKRESIEFRAKATPITLTGLDLVVLALHDISDQKRRGALEQSFLHDARNLLSGIVTWTDVLQQDRPDEGTTSLRTLALQLRELLSGHSVLAQAEKGELAVSNGSIDLSALARMLNQSFSHHPSGEGKTFVVHFPGAAAALISDQNILMRILSNMVTNALEASAVGATVEVRYELLGGHPTFSVHNSGAIPEHVAPRIFQRSFSTKTEPGHGLGTYGMRLLAEQYLGGHVSFTSSRDEGTTFSLVLPGPE
jgi:hypothetical protein